MKRRDAVRWGVVVLGCIIFAIFLSVTATHLLASEPVLHSGQSATGSPEMHEAPYAIDEGGRNPDKAWAEKEVADAQEAVDKANGIINWFLGNSSTAMDPRLPPFIAERDDAARILDSAKGDLEMGNYSLARSKAAEAHMKANGSYNNAISRREQLLTCDCCGHSQIPGGIFVIAAGIAAIILLIGGILWWKKQKTVKQP